MRVRAATENLPIPQIYQEEANRLSSSTTASAMLPVKERVAYISLFCTLKDHAIARGRQFSPQLILSDFESGLIPTVRAEFLDVHHQGCYFHFTQAIWRKVQELGLARHYMEDQLVRVTVQ
ncbi:hypothetical protein R1sor_021200 [Riccia sorocarpa]|uniref:MULE transposase domain-containing protein n=1 Tax=Riccia sorocarpa TaxID=122646 RepID=A0ABD3GM32_9MARC